MKPQGRKIVTLGILLALALIYLSVSLLSAYMSDDLEPPAYGQVIEFISNNDVEKVVVKRESKVLDIHFSSDSPWSTQSPVSISYPEGDESRLLERIEETGVRVEVDGETGSIVMSTILSLLPIFLLLGILVFIFVRSARGAGGGPFSIGKAKPKKVDHSVPGVTFADVAGIDEVEEELRDIKDFLENSSKYKELGAKVPKGVLLFGPPGTGKTLIARAIAGEAGVPFFSISGSEFVEMFVGVGASRVRNLFEQVKAAAPAIIFIDEIDAVGRQRGAGHGGGHDEREQTLNQLLVEMDGFDNQTNVIVIAATNRPDILDKALLRPGRFDRQITVAPPDAKGREKILEVHARGKPIAEDVNLNDLAKQTATFTGADLANLINEAALLAARKNKKSIHREDIDEAANKIIAGPERKGALSEQEQEVVAWHEAGHGIVGYALENGDPVHKITIIPSGRALGYTLAMPENDQYIVFDSPLLDKLAMMLGGRAAEIYKYGRPTTGAANDIQKATDLARKMVKEYGMSGDLGPVNYNGSGDPFAGRDMGKGSSHSEQYANHIDEAVKELLDNALEEALEILNTYGDRIERMVETLLEHEKVEGVDEIRSVFGEDLEGSVKRGPNGLQHTISSSVG